MQSKGISYIPRHHQTFLVSDYLCGNHRLILNYVNVVYYLKIKTKPCFLKWFLIIIFHFSKFPRKRKSNVFRKKETKSINFAQTVLLHEFKGNTAWKLVSWSLKLGGGEISHSWVLKTFKGKSSCFIIIRASHSVDQGADQIYLRTLLSHAFLQHGVQE